VVARVNVLDIETWLAEKGSTLWGEAHEIISGPGRHEAALWFYRQLEDFDQWKLSSTPR
jgi:hypothetical protein